MSNDPHLNGQEAFVPGLKDVQQMVCLKNSASRNNLLLQELTTHRAPVTKPQKRKGISRS